MSDSSIRSASEPRACAECLRRGALLAALAPYLERVAVGGPGVAGTLALPSEQLAQGVALSSAERLLAEQKRRSERELRDALISSGCWATCPHDDHFPAALREDPLHPWALYGRGDPRHLRRSGDELVALIGARRATSYGRDVARGLGHELAASGLTVISGMAFGIDACAHRGALEAGPTIAVLACGPDVAYPATHRSLWRRIQEQGAVISELPPGTGAWRWAFPARSRIIAGLASLTVVVEAAERSGSMIAARAATRIGRQLGAVPGPINSRSSAGANALLAEGAIVVRGVDDLLEGLADFASKEASG